MNKKLIYYTQKKEKEKKSLIAWEKCVRWGFFFFFNVFYIFVYQKKKKLWIVYTCDNSIWGGKTEDHLVGNLVEPQQYCQIHIERKNFGIPSKLPYFDNWNIYTVTTCNLYIPIILLNLLDQPSESNKKKMI